MEVARVRGEGHFDRLPLYKLITNLLRAIYNHGPVFKARPLIYMCFVFTQFDLVGLSGEGLKSGFCAYNLFIFLNVKYIGTKIDKELFLIWCIPA